MKFHFKLLAITNDNIDVFATKLFSFKKINANAIALSSVKSINAYMYAANKIQRHFFISSIYERDQIIGIFKVYCVQLKSLFFFENYH